MGLSCRVLDNMKVLVALSLIALAAAKPQYIQQPWMIPTIKSADTTWGTPVYNTYASTYPYGGFPWVQTALPSNYRYPFTSWPFANIAQSTVTKQEETTRQKRSADAEAEADPAMVYTSNIDSTMSNTAMNYRYTGLPASFSTYNYPQTQNIATIPYTGFTPNTRMWSYSSMTPYSSFSWMNPSQYTGVSRARRSAEPEADPQVLTTGFSYPAINTRTYPSTYTYRNFPTTYNTGFPSTYSTGFPFQYGNFPTTTGVIYG